MASQVKEKGGDAADAARAAPATQRSLQAVSGQADIAIATNADTLASAMACAFAEIESATKSANNPHFKSKYADITAVIGAIKPALIAHGLFFTQHCQPCENGVQVETHLHHMNGESMSLGSLYVPANKNDAQGFGSALTYARRYALITAFGVPTEDDDGNAASKAGPRQEAAPQTLTDADLVKIQQLCEAVGGNQPGLICNAYKIDALPDLTPSQAKAVIGKLTDKLAEKVKAETDAKATEDA